MNSGYWRNCADFLTDSPLCLAVKKLASKVRGKAFSRLAGGYTAPLWWRPTNKHQDKTSVLKHLDPGAWGDPRHCLASVLASLMGYLSTNSHCLPQTPTEERSVLPQPPDVGLGCLTCLGSWWEEYAFLFLAGVNGVLTDVSQRRLGLLCSSRCGKKMP